mgnify:FL=1
MYKPDVFGTEHALRPSITKDYLRKNKVHKFLCQYTTVQESVSLLVAVIINLLIMLDFQVLSRSEDGSDL